MGSAGSTTSALAFAGEVGPNTAKTELWNGTNWAEVNDMNTAQQNPGSAGASNASALSFGGSAGGGETELWAETGGNKTITS